MRYIWINPVTESMYEEPVMEEFLTKHGFTRVRCMVDWGQAVKEKYREMLDGCRDTVADARCPMACGLVEALAVDGVRAAAIEPILIHCAREISGRRDLKVRPFFLQMLKPVLFIAVIVCKTAVQRTHIAGSVVRTAEAVHVTIEAFGRRAYTATVVLLGAAVGVDVTIEFIELLLCDVDALLGGAEIDVVLLFIGCH